MAKEKTVPVTELTTIGDQAPTFPLPIKLTKLDGTAVKFTITAKALKKTEWAKHRDERQRAIFEGMQAANQKAHDVTAAGGDATTYLDSAIANIEKYGVEAGVRDSIALEASLILKFAESWSLQDGLDADKLAAMEDTYGGSLSTILSNYDKAIYQGRLGNSD